MPRQPKQIYQIKITLERIHPPIWRRIQVPSDTTLQKLHDIIQIVMGWQDYHLHMFTIGDAVYGNPADDEFGEMGTLDESRYKLRRLIDRAGQRFSYEYDFGDSWDHTLLVEKILPPEPGVHYPVCLKGQRACPPEDVGGSWGYENFLEAIGDPEHEEHEEYLTWVGGKYDPKAFSLEKVNAELRGMGRGRSIEALNSWLMDDDGETMPLEANPAWLQALSEEQNKPADDLPLRRDVVTLLTYLRDHKVTGTQSTGNFPLKDVYAVCAQFVHPPKMEEIIWKTTYRVRSEDEVWPLKFTHILASISGLITGGLGRRWKLTRLGEDYLSAGPASQAWQLAAAWWIRGNWATATSHSFAYGYVPRRFTQTALQLLLDLPTGEPTAFDAFADRLIAESGLVYPVSDQEYARRSLHATIHQILVDPLTDLGLLNTEYRASEILGADFPEPASLLVSPMGRTFLAEIQPLMDKIRPYP